ncbi:receptor-type tyrosine-protein phosphatase alpha-like [Biomphalaria glabrata]|uniref:protein-tyrosine-phosphatase n=2 Tax=Biomphalaria glabrata TaxID=6526 RepID=A0A9W3ABU7_BIOGL|nr:receptor-type tyrosine-protein phosphatase alpha-like [Biomphalaria glabrata]
MLKILNFTNHFEIDCDITTWGENCTQNCSTLCKNSSCDYFTGQCKKGCKSGHWGEFCNESCGQNCADQTCVQETGDCYGGCKEGYKPPNCKEACSLGNYGFNCSEKCSSQCRNSCEPTSGECINGCKDGYAGPNCNKICESGTYGAACSQTCSPFCNGLRCHHISGNCYGGCTKGYMNLLCNETCPSGYYGLHCTGECSTHCNESNKCDHVDGTCFNGCKDGFLGSTCISVCTRNTYGQNCAQNCSLHCATNNSASRCDHRTGECLVGCVQGYKQPFCLERIPSEGSLLTVILLICIVLLLALIVVVILFNKEARSKMYTQCENLSRTNSNKTYSNMKDVPVQQLPTSISVKDLGSYINTHSSDFFQDEFKRISGPANVTYEVGLSEQNNRKNRYKNIIPYDHSRVHLQTITNELEDYYINASYVKDHQNQNKYIATQGPNFVSLNDFIRMLWELRVEQVVMLTNLAEDSKVKCEQYWPKSGTKEYGTIEVRLTHTKNFTNYIVRFLELVKDKEVQKVTQYHYISWPDHGVPSSPWALVEFEQRVSAIKTSTPLVVHCSAGVGRTGTFIALQNILQQAEQTGQVDIFSSVVKLRQDRLLMVQTAGQYEFLHVAVLGAIACSKATLHISNIKYLPDNQTLKNEYLTVCSVISTLSRTKEEEDNLEEENVNESENVYENFKTDLRNRFPTIVPSDKDRPMLSCEPKDNGDYINAVFIQNFDKKSRHIVTQLPMPTTVVEFWRLVTQYNVSVLVAFETDSMVKDKTVSKFAPSSAESALKCGPFNVHNLSYTDDNLWDEQSLQVQSDLAKEKLISVTCLYVKFTDLDTRKHVSLLKKLSSYKLQKDQKIVYMCRNGATYSGFLCVLSLLMERLETESSFNVPLIVGATKTVRPEVVPTFSQYKAIYEILASYNERQDENHLPVSVKVNNPIFDESQTDDANIYCNV